MFFCFVSCLSLSLSQLEIFPTSGILKMKTILQCCKVQTNNSPKQKQKENPRRWKIPSSSLSPSSTKSSGIITSSSIVVAVKQRPSRLEKRLLDVEKHRKNERNGERLRLARLAPPPETLTSKASPSRDVTSLPLGQSARTPHARGPISSRAPPGGSQSRVPLAIARCDVIVVTSPPKHRRNRSKRDRTITYIGESCSLYFEVNVPAGKPPLSLFYIPIEIDINIKYVSWAKPVNIPLSNR